MYSGLYGCRPDDSIDRVLEIGICGKRDELPTFLRTTAPGHLRGYIRFLSGVVKASVPMRSQANLTRAEFDALRALWDGTTLFHVAHTLGKSPKTVRCQVASNYGKLGASNRTQALRRATELGVISGTPC